MQARYPLILVALVFFSLAPGLALSQASLDISVPSSFPMSPTTAYGFNTTASVWGPVDVFKDGTGVYVAIPTNAPAGEKLSLFQDTNASWALFRNNTLVMPIEDQAVNFVLATGDLVSDGSRFYGQVTGMELDTNALSAGDASAAAALYLNGLPDRASYHISIADDDGIKKAILNEASKAGQPGNVKLMLNVTGANTEAQSSIGYSIIRMKAGDEPDGNVTAYRYLNGATARLPCKAITSAEGAIYETIYAGPGAFAFVGPFPEPPPEKAGAKSVLIFAGALAFTMALLVAFIIKGLKWSTKKE